MKIFSYVELKHNKVLHTKVIGCDRFMYIVPRLRKNCMLQLRQNLRKIYSLKLFYLEQHKAENS